MSSSAQRDLYEESFEEQPAYGATGTDGVAGLRRIAAERLAAHRSKRVSAEPRAVETAAAPVVSAAAQRVRDAVAARYERSLSYREFLETQPVVAPVSPWVEETVRVATPVAVPGGEISGESAAEVSTADVPAMAAPALLEEQAWDWQTRPVAFEGELEVRPYEELPQPTPLPERSRVEPEVHPEEIEGLEEEIEFRLAPEFDQHLIEPLPIQANIIEFPRQLVAAHKARPRLAEGPLRHDEVVQPAAPVQAEVVPEFQMRIFEVESEVVREMEAPPIVQAVAAEPIVESVVAEPVAPEWQELVLDAPVKEFVAPLPQEDSYAELAASAQERLALPVAPFELRLMSSAVDAVCIGMSFVAFVTVAVWMSGHAVESALRGTSIVWLVVGSVIAVALLAVIYQAVFFTLGATTPGMSYAGLVFRSMANKEPSRRAMRRRVGANVLAVAPLGLGVLWSFVDGQGLGWNDKMSGVFLREF